MTSHLQVLLRVNLFQEDRLDGVLQLLRRLLRAAERRLACSCSQVTSGAQETTGMELQPELRGLCSASCLCKAPAEDLDPCWDYWYGVTCNEHGYAGFPDGFDEACVVMAGDQINMMNAERQHDRKAAAIPAPSVTELCFCKTSTWL